MTILPVRQEASRFLFGTLSLRMLRRAELPPFGMGTTA